LPQSVKDEIKELTLAVEALEGTDRVMLTSRFSGFGGMKEKYLVIANFTERAIEYVIGGDHKILIEPDGFVTSFSELLGKVVEIVRRTVPNVREGVRVIAYLPAGLYRPNRTHVHVDVMGQLVPVTLIPA
jgi:hypothetical protein